MKKFRHKSKAYLNWLHSSGRVVGPKSGKLDAHHTATFSRGAAKNKDDFNAILVNHEIHLGVIHGKSEEDFWESVGIRPEEKILELLEAYQKEMQLSWFDSGEDYDTEHEVLDEHIQELKGRQA